MAGTSIEQLQLSVRASNVLHRLGIHNIEELIKTPLEDIAQQRNIGAKTLDEIKHILENADHIIEHAAELADNSVESDITPAFTEEQLSEMSRHSIEELGLSVRPIHALYRDGYSTIDKVAQMSEVDFSQMKGIGKKSIDEIKVSVSTWIKDNISYEGNRCTLWIYLLKEGRSRAAGCREQSGQWLVLYGRISTQSRTGWYEDL